MFVLTLFLKIKIGRDFVGHTHKKVRATKKSELWQDVQKIFPFLSSSFFVSSCLCRAWFSCVLPVVASTSYFFWTIFFLEKMLNFDSFFLKPFLFTFQLFFLNLCYLINCESAIPEAKHKFHRVIFFIAHVNLQIMYLFVLSCRQNN